MKILGLSGSLRAASVNTAMLQVMTQLAHMGPAGVEMRVFDGMASLPLFNPDMEDKAPPPVLRLRAALRQADAVVIASPEYAHGVTGVIKNALDWVVGSGELVGKPVALLIASSRAEYAPAALGRTLAVMDARLLDAAGLAVPVNSSRAGSADILALPEAVDVLRQVLDRLAQTPA